MNVWMLDTDPITAARAHCDQHVKQAPFAYAQTLAFAWHALHNEMYTLMEGDSDVITPTPWFARVDNSAPYTKSNERPRALFPGESPWVYWTLFGQRVPARRCDYPSPQEFWVEELGGNYRWLWQLAMEVTAEYQHRFGKRHPAAPSIWTLEVVPFALEVTLDTWTEPPLDLPEHLKVRDGEFYDAVASNRRFYNTHQHQFAWTRREPPEWLTHEETPASEET